MMYKWLDITAKEPAEAAVSVLGIPLRRRREQRRLRPEYASLQSFICHVQLMTGMCFPKILYMISEM